MTGRLSGPRSTPVTAEPSPGSDELLLRPGSLAAALGERTRRAIDCGALQHIETEQVVVDDGGVSFLLSVASSLRHKAAASSPRATGARPAVKPCNPFLPPEPELTVAAVSRSHLAVLNKFNVLQRHLLIVTRDFEEQQTLLTLADFRALCACMAEYASLGFYNGGSLAGASQPHKHLQLVPLPFAGAGPGVPMAPLLTGGGPRCPALPFAHAFGRLAVPLREQPLVAADEAHGLYRALLAELGIGALARDGGEYQSAAYNLLVADGWMLAVPRARDCWQGISINALGLAGSLFVRDRAHLDLIRAEGPMTVLQKVAGC